ncbi:MAG: DUF2971 domain-containing protein [Planctomycetaceae bacterium]|nr:DUF2971 domain-containing protein [Planctomycetaceae bacterium]
MLTRHDVSETTAATNRQIELETPSQTSKHFVQVIATCLGFRERHRMANNPDIPPVVYHYCGVDAFRGILASKQLWLSDVHFMNDATEQTHFTAMATKVLRDWPSGPTKVFIQLLLNNFEWMRLNPYACCFCKDGDLLSQWCRYADDGSGFAIGFSSVWLREQRMKYAPKHPLALLEVEYDDERQLKLVTDCVDEYLKEVPGLDRNGRQNVSMRAILRLWWLSAACKNHSFHEEREVRLILAEIADPESEAESARKQVGISPIFHRSRGADSVPYFRLGFSEQAIVEIHLGPTNCEKDDHSDPVMFLKTNGYNLDQIRIEPSRAPYRH